MVCKPVAKDGLHIVLDGWPDLGVSFSHVHLLRFPLDVVHLTLDVLFFPVLSDNAL
jgi:hypothetical protein